MALYRKYRPQSFDDFVNQEHVKLALKNAIERNEVAHAYVFTGPRGTGKTSMARVFAKALGVTDLDLIEVDGATYSKVEEMRDLIDKVGISPTASPFKVYVIDEVHMLSTHSFNALLKTLEEPPRHAIFVLVTTELQKIPLTVLSRCQRFDFKRLGDAEVSAHLIHVAQAEGLKLTPEVAGIITQASGGSVRDSQAHLEQLMAYGLEDLTPEAVQKLLGIVDEASLVRLTEAVINKDFKGAIDLVRSFTEKGVDLVALVRSWTKWFQAELYLNVEGSPKLALSVKELANMIKRLVELEATMKTSFLPEASLEVFLAETIGTSDVAQRITGESHPPQKEEIEPTVDSPTPVVTEEITPEATQVLEDEAPAPVEARAASFDLKNLTEDEICELWQQVVAKVKVNQPYLAANLEQARCEVAGEVMKFTVKSHFVAGQLRSSKYLAPLYETLRGVVGEELELEFAVDSEVLPTISEEHKTRPVGLDEVSKVFG